jgi:alpha-ketoglutarate-dependent taurine dioxygenase
MTTTRSASYALVPVSPVLGAEVAGIDLANGVDESTAAALREDFWRHKILVFRNQHLSPDAHVEAVRIFDEPFDHPLWLHRNPDNRLVYTFDLEHAVGASTWHAGGTWRNPPFNIESLTYEVVPEIGGRSCGPICTRHTTGYRDRSRCSWKRSAPCTAPTRAMAPTTGRR